MWGKVLKQETVRAGGNTVEERECGRRKTVIERDKRAWDWVKRDSVGEQEDYVIDSDGSVATAATGCDVVGS